MTMLSVPKMILESNNAVEGRESRRTYFEGEIGTIELSFTIFTRISNCNQNTKMRSHSYSHRE